MTTDIINQLINQYTGSLTNIQTGSIALGKELFNVIALISVAVLGLDHLLRKNVDLSDTNIELIRWILYLDFFYAFIVNYPSIYSFVYSSIQQIGNYLGAQASGGSAVDLSPANIFHIGISLSLKIISSNVKLNLFRNFLYPLVSVVVALVILFCFASIGLELILVQIGSQVILAGGIFLLAFSGFQWTRDYAERYVHTFFHIGIKMVFIYILVGLGVGLTQNWVQVVTNPSTGTIYDYDIAIGLAAYIYYKLCVKLPDQAVSWLTGRLSMGFETFPDVKGAISAPKKIYEGGKRLYDGYKKVTDWAVGKAAGMQGNAQAYDAAQQAAIAKFEAQGKTASQKEIQKEAVRTLGQARWKKVVDETAGAKLAKDILENIPKTDTKSETGAKTDDGDYSI